MSIGLLNQVFDETRRLSIAGSSLAGGDFRLKKLVTPLKKAGEKAAVFGKVAEAAERLVDGSEKDSAEALLDLSTLVIAILHTQGQSDVDGDVGPLDTVDLGMHGTRATARTLKPLLDALTTTGSGRQQIIEEAHARGVFKDLRLIQPALGAVDDVYGEIADFVADKVLPIYGECLVPVIRDQIDIKGKSGHARRLRLLHRLDPARARSLVEEALESGSKEVKIAAIRCLGASPDDLAALLEHAKARSKDVRAAAYVALAPFTDEDVVEVFRKAMSGADVSLVGTPLSRNRSPKLLGIIIEEAEKQLEALFTIKDRKKVTTAVARFIVLLGCLEGRSDKKTRDFLIRCFEQRDRIAKLKSDHWSDINEHVAIILLEMDSKPARDVLVEAHATLSPELLVIAFQAAVRSRPPRKVYDLFSPYLKASITKKDPTAQKREAIARNLGGFGDDDDERLRWDPRWLDDALEMAILDSVLALAKPGHRGVEKFLEISLQRQMKNRRQWPNGEAMDVLRGMVYLKHPRATESLLEAIPTITKQKPSYGYYRSYLARLVADLPAEAAPKVEALLPTLPDDWVDDIAPHLAELQTKR